MAQCNHGNPYLTAPDAVILSLPECQAGSGRHKCAVCAYNEGLLAADGKDHEGTLEECPNGVSAPQDMLRALPTEQGGLQRHRCAYTAYRKGLEDGQIQQVIKEFEQASHNIDRTEALAMQKVRIGQQYFRRELLKHWNNKCPITGITDTTLLRASHIKPWSKCNDDHERLSVFNGILLSPLFDTAFDAGLITFNDKGEHLLSDKLSARAIHLLNLSAHNSIQFYDRHFPFLEWHRQYLFH